MPSGGVDQLATPRKIKSVTAQVARQRNNRVIEAMSTLLSTGGAIGAFFAGFTLNIVVLRRRSQETRSAALLSDMLLLLCPSGAALLCGQCCLRLLQRGIPAYHDRHSYAKRKESRSETTPGQMEATLSMGSVWVASDLVV